MINLPTDSFHKFINTNSYTDYVVADMSYIRALKIDDRVFPGVKLIDIFQLLNSNYLFLKISPAILPAVFTYYQESSYEFQFIIPWIKVNFDEISLIDLTSRFKGLVDYLVVFQKPDTKSIKSKLKSLVVEEDLFTTINRWEKELITGMTELGFQGIYVAPDGMYDKSDEIVKTKPRDKKIELF